MKYAVLLDKAAARFLLRPAMPNSKRVWTNPSNRSQPTPVPPGCRKLAGTSDRYRIRVGDYRMVYSVDDGKVTVLVLAIGHRREVYEGL